MSFEDKNEDISPPGEDLAAWGWNDYFAAQFHEHKQAGLIPARVLVEFNKFYRVMTTGGEVLAEISGKLKHEAESRSGLPAVGDWVALRPGARGETHIIQAILPRRTKFARKIKGTKTEEQIVGANIDTVFLVTSLNQDFNRRRIERYLSIAWESGARPVILLTKTDLCQDVDEKIAETEEVSAGVPVHAICSIKEEGLEDLQGYFKPGRTVALIGSSGVGKSTLLNRLLGREQQKVLEVREYDDRGRHATRHRELIMLPSGGLILDTPGMRELQLWDVDHGLETTFEDIEELASACRFSDCAHQSEPGCAVRQAIDDGSLDQERFDNYLKLQQELNYLARRQDALAQQSERNRWKKLSRMAEERSKFKRSGK